MAQYHAPLPWQADHGRLASATTANETPVIVDESGIPLIVAGFKPSSELEAQANTAFIVRAVNCHDDLVAAARRVLDGLHARISAADPSAVPVFDGIAELSSVLAKAGAK